MHLPWCMEMLEIAPSSQSRMVLVYTTVYENLDHCTDFNLTSAFNSGSLQHPLPSPLHLYSQSRMVLVYTTPSVPNYLSVLIGTQILRNL
jgi:hypothetical protein